MCIDTFHKKISRNEYVNRYLALIPKLKDLLREDKAVDPKKLIYFGLGYGAEVALLGGLADKDVKAICCSSMHLIEEDKLEQYEIIDKIYLVHCKDDKISPYEEFVKNKERLNVKEGDYLVYDLGGHDLLSQEPSTAAFCSIKIKQKLNPIYKLIERRDF